MSSDLKWSDITNIQWSSHTKFFSSVQLPPAKKVLYIFLVRFHCFTSHPSAVLIFHFQLSPWKQRVQRRATKFILNNYVSNCRLCFRDIHLLYTAIDGPLRKVFERKKNTLFKTWKKQKLRILLTK